MQISVIKLLGVRLGHVLLVAMVYVDDSLCIVLEGDRLFRLFQL